MVPLFHLKIRYDLILWTVCRHSAVLAVAKLFVDFVNIDSGCSMTPTSIEILFSNIKSVEEIFEDVIRSESCCCVDISGNGTDVDSTVVILPAVFTLIEFLLLSYKSCRS